MNLPSVARPAARRGLAAYAVAALAANGAAIVGILHVFRTPGYISTGSLRYLLIWACGINLCAVALLLLLGRSWRRRFWLLASIDLLVSVSPFLLIRLLRIQGLQPRMEAIGFAYTALVSVRCFLLVAQLALNARSANRNAVRAWVFLASLAVYLSFAPWIAQSVWPFGDEPHYLILTQSLIADHDVNLANNYSQGDYKSFYPPTLDRHVIRAGPGKEFPIHDIGLSILLVPGYLVGNRTGALVELGIPAALTALGIAELALQLGADIVSALLAWSMFAFAMPLLVYASQVYPEMVGAAGVLWAVIAFVRFTRDGRTWWLWLSGAMLALLPWFSVRFWTVMGSLLGVMAVSALWPKLLDTPQSDSWKSRLSKLVPLGVPTVISLVLFAIFDSIHYGMLLPNAGYVLDLREQAVPVLTPRLHVGLLGLFFDRAYGLLPIAPVYILVACGIRQLVRTNRAAASAILFPTAVYIVFTSLNRYWTGGWCPPGRFLVVPTALCSPVAASLFSIRRTRWIAVPLSLWTGTVAFLEMAFPNTRFAALPDVTRTGLSVFFAEHIGFDPITGLFPSLVRAQRTDFVLAAVWLVLLGCGVWLIGRYAAPLPAALESNRHGKPFVRGASLSGPDL